MTIYNLQDTSGTEDQGCYDKTPSSTEPGSQWPYTKATEEGSSLKYADAVAVDLGLLRIGVSEIMLKTGKSQDTANNAGVVGKQERADTTEADDIASSKSAETLAHDCLVFGNARGGLRWFTLLEGIIPSRGGHIDTFVAEGY
jgi:hypothetical protein